jgi:hypothetical protein
VKKPLFLFGDIVVVEDIHIGAVVKTWQGMSGTFNYDVYVRSYNCLKNYEEPQIERYRVRHKYLSEEERDWQDG